jgi:hypothetical protein
MSLDGIHERPESSSNLVAQTGVDAEEIQQPQREAELDVPDDREAIHAPNGLEVLRRGAFARVDRTPVPTAARGGRWFWFPQQLEIGIVTSDRNPQGPSKHRDLLK